MRSNSYTLEPVAWVSASEPVASVSGRAASVSERAAPVSASESVVSVSEPVASVSEPVASAWATEELVVELPVAPQLLPA